MGEAELLFANYVRRPIVTPDSSGDGIPDLLTHWYQCVDLIDGGSGLGLGEYHDVRPLCGGYEWEVRAVALDANADGLADVAVGSAYDEVVAIHEAPFDHTWYRKWWHASWAIEYASPISSTNGFGARLHTPGDVDGDGYPELWVGDGDYFAEHQDIYGTGRRGDRLSNNAAPFETTKDTH